MQKQYCSYYQAQLERTKTWFVVGSLRNEDHIAFERAVDGQVGLFEFLVPQDQEQAFLHLMQYFLNHGHVLWLEKKPNRFAQNLVL
jgi:hypothetical protein